ncbi:hypothetical protein GGS26DRAFT_572475 [Hypomontagnella submonticulosa]|nr:hypothetical protein GGS26DRAFT_572475 [Hypomontagnella submonticulosa]
MDPQGLSLAREVISFARENSPYHSHLYQSIQKDELDLKDVPITNPDDYWKFAKPDPANVTTGPFLEGKAYCINGPDDDPETVYVTKDENRELSKTRTTQLADVLGLEKGDRIANIMTTRDLSIGFWEMINLFNGMFAPVESSQLMISSEKSTESIIQEVRFFNANVLFAPLFEIIRLAEHLSKIKAALTAVKLILYLGNTVPKEFHSMWRAAFPNAKLFAPPYTKLDLGALGVPSPITQSGIIARDTNPEYTVCSSTILEIVTDGGDVITESGIKGNVVVTNLVRRLQPVIRYPIGETAEWVDYPARTFKYHGKAPPKVKLANTTLDWSLVSSIVSSAMDTDITGRFQCVLRHDEGKPKIIIRLAFPKIEAAGELRHRIEKALWSASRKYKLDRMSMAILSLRLEWVDKKGLVVDEIGEVRKIVDERPKSPEKRLLIRGGLEERKGSFDSITARLPSNLVARVRRIKDSASFTRP